MTPLPDDVRLLFEGPNDPLRTDRIVFLIEPDRAWAQAYG